MQMRTKSPVIQALQLSAKDEGKLKEPLKFTPEALEKLTMDLMGYPFISFGNALLCPKCGVQQGVLTNVAPDGEVNFYLNFRCDDYKALELQREKELAEKEAFNKELTMDVSDMPSPETSVESSTQENQDPQTHA